MAVIRKRPIEIDDYQFETVGEAAKAYGKDRKFLYKYMKGSQRNSFTSTELHLDGITPQIDPSNLKAKNLTWDFVYRQVASSPKPRRVDSIHYPFAA